TPAGFHSGPVTPSPARLPRRARRPTWWAGECGPRESSLIGYTYEHPNLRRSIEPVSTIDLGRAIQPERATLPAVRQVVRAVPAGVVRQQQRTRLKRVSPLPQPGHFAVRARTSIRGFPPEPVRVRADQLPTV